MANYNEMTKDELLNLAEERGLEVSESLKKEEIIQLHRVADERGEEAARAEGEPKASVEWIGPKDQVCDDLLPYQEERAALETGKTYEAPESVVRKLVLNGNFTPADERAEQILREETRSSRVGEMRARQLLAAPVSSVDSDAHAFARRVGIADRPDVVAQATVQPEATEFDPNELIPEEDG